MVKSMAGCSDHQLFQSRGLKKMCERIQSRTLFVPELQELLEVTRKALLDNFQEVLSNSVPGHLTLRFTWESRNAQT